MATSVSLRYTVNCTGVTTPAEVASIMQAAPLFSASLLELLGCTLTSQIADAIGTTVTLHVVLNISSATFRLRFPSVVSLPPGAAPSAKCGPFANLMTSVLRNAALHPVLAAQPVFS